MDFANSSESPQQFGAVPTPPAGGGGGKKGSGWKILWGIITGLSVLANLALFLILIGVVILFAAGQERKVAEEVLKEGPRTSRIAVISIDGIIDDEQYRNVYWQLKKAKEDRHVKGLIVRVDSPGGTMSGSDQIYNEILKYRREEEKPVVAFMQGVAASGGYYSSVACDEIIAEPTTITGSIGVSMGYLVLEQLLEDKLGIQPIIVKAGEKKDWPSSFQMPTDEQLQYMQDRIITPAYERFRKIVVDGRKELTKEDVNRLADGSIYWADQALEVKLIDDIGYLDDAIEKVKSMAGIEKAQVVEYRRPFSLSDILGAEAKTPVRIDRKLLYELTVPQVLYLWTGPQ
jgi:protease-4